MAANSVTDNGICAQLSTTVFEGLWTLGKLH